MSIVAYFVQGWRALSITTSALGLLPLFLLVFVPESPRWLVAKQKYDQADHVIRKIAIGKTGIFNIWKANKNGKRYAGDAISTAPILYHKIILPRALSRMFNFHYITSWD